MSKKSNSINSPQKGSRLRKTREEIEKMVKAVLDPESLSNKKKMVVIPPSRSEKADFEEISESLNIEADSIKYRILKLYCQEKKTSVVNVNALIHRIENWSNEQLKVLELISGEEELTAKDVLNFVESIKRLGTNRILTLRAFVDLKGMGSGPLHQFFRVSLPQSKQEEVGPEEYQREVREKMMTPDQVNVFYNICSRITDITPKTAVEILPKTRQLKQQHVQIMNTFLKESVFFGDKPITTDNIPGLINLWLSLPEIKDKTRFHRLIKWLSRKPDSKKKDFQFIIMSFKEEIERENGKSNGKMISSIRDFFS